VLLGLCSALLCSLSAFCFVFSFSFWYGDVHGTVCEGVAGLSFSFWFHLFFFLCFFFFSVGASRLHRLLRPLVLGDVTLGKADGAKQLRVLAGKHFAVDELHMAPLVS